ncbi:MAG: hypothetical protein WC430_01380 [Patescibacteria group bacterium]
MPEEIPQFSSKPLEEEKSKKPARRKKIAATNAIHRASGRKKEIDERLFSIYEDGSGNMPDMKEIKIKKPKSFLKTLLAFLFVAISLSAATLAGYFFFSGSEKFSESQVVVAISGPEKITLGEPNDYIITYENNQGDKINNVTLNVYYPSGFIFQNSSTPSENPNHTEWNIGSLSPNEKGEITITGLTYGSIGQKQSWRLFFNYQPINFQSELQNNATFNVEISESPISVALTGPDKVVVGNAVEYSFAIENKSAWQPERMEITPIIPANFSVSTSTPALDKNGKWIITKKTSTSTPEKIIYPMYKIKGQFINSEDETSPVKVAISIPSSDNSQLFQIAEGEIKTELVKNDLNFNMAINGTTTDFSSHSGDTLNISLRLKNEGKNDIKNASIKLTAEGPSISRKSVIDWQTISDDYDGDIKGEQMSDSIRRGIITWNSAKIPALAKIQSGKEIVVDIRLPIKNSNDFDIGSSPEYLIKMTAAATFKDKTNALQTILGNPINITLNSDLNFENEDNISTANGKEEHKISWILANHYHSLKNIVLTADIYGDTALTEQIETPAGEIKITQTDAKTKKITWTIPEMPESVDILALPFTIILNSKNPTQQTLVSKVHIQAEDTITSQKLDFMGDEILLK